MRLDVPWLVAIVFLYISTSLSVYYISGDGRLAAFVAALQFGITGIIMMFRWIRS